MPVSRCWERACFSQRSYSFQYVDDWEWQPRPRASVAERDLNSSGFHTLSEDAVGRPWLALSLAKTKPTVGLGFDHGWCSLISPKHRNQGTYCQGSWVNLISCQFLHFSSKFGCFRDKYIWFLPRKRPCPQPSYPCTPQPAGDHLCSPGLGGPVLQQLCPNKFVTRVSELVFPYEGLELSRLKVSYWCVYPCTCFDRHGSGISLHVLCLCFN